MANAETLFGLPVVENAELVTPMLDFGPVSVSMTFEPGPGFNEFIAHLNDQARTTATWRLSEETATRIRRHVRHILLVDHHGQSPKNRRIKRGGKRLL